MALVPCAACRQPFYASCHDASCIDALCPHCEYGDAEGRMAEGSMTDGRAVIAPDGAKPYTTDVAPLEGWQSG